jgi:3-methyladenine DNA glycosylase AlkD
VGTSETAAELAETLSARLSEIADADYGRGAAAHRRPGKPVLGVAIPDLRATVRTQVRPYRDRPDVVMDMAHALWHKMYHEEELAACMALRLTGGRLQAEHALRWAELLDNWLSVDELAGCLSETLIDAPEVLPDLRPLAESSSPWQRRLYVAALIKPVCRGLDPGDIPGLPSLLNDRRQPVQKACSWMIRQAMKQRPASVSEFSRICDADVPRPLTRLFDHAKLKPPVGAGA